METPAFETNTLTNRNLNVFVLDRNEHPIPGAVVTIAINGVDAVSATTRGAVAAPLRLQAPDELKVVTVRAEYRYQGAILQQEATVALDEGNFTFVFQEVSMPGKVPDWFPKAGYASGAATLVYFMYVARIAPGPPNFADIVVMALGVALTASFLGGSAIARGTLPIPYLGDPLAISVGGGIAVFVIVLVLGYTLFLRNPEPTNPNQISIAFGEPVALQVAIDTLEKSKNVTVVFGSTCPADAGKAILSAGTHSGRDPQEFLENLQHRLRSSNLRYSATLVRGVRYEIVCS